jgi:hypothetical protein
MGMEKSIGEVIHYYGKISVAVLELSGDLHVGDRVHFRGRHTDFEQTIDSMQIEHEVVTEVEGGGEVAVKVADRVRTGDQIFLMDDESS